VNGCTLFTADLWDVHPPFRKILLPNEPNSNFLLFSFLRLYSCSNKFFCLSNFENSNQNLKISLRNNFENLHPKFFFASFYSFGENLNLENHSKKTLSDNKRVDIHEIIVSCILLFFIFSGAITWFNWKAINFEGEKVEKGVPSFQRKRTGKLPRGSFMETFQRNFGVSLIKSQGISERICIDKTRFDFSKKNFSFSFCFSQILFLMTLIIWVYLFLFVKRLFPITNLLWYTIIHNSNFLYRIEMNPDDFLSKHFIKSDFSWPDLIWSALSLSLPQPHPLLVLFFVFFNSGFSASSWYLLHGSFLFLPMAFLTAWPSSADEITFIKSSGFGVSSTSEMSSLGKSWRISFSFFSSSLSSFL